MAQTRPFVLPGDPIDLSEVSWKGKNQLRLGPGVRHIPPSDVLPTVAGQLFTDARKNTIWVENKGGRVRRSFLYHISVLPR